MTQRLERMGTGVSATGTLVLLAGLAWDAGLHRLDPTPAAREGLLTANPGHALAATGPPAWPTWTRPKRKATVRWRSAAAAASSTSATIHTMGVFWTRRIPSRSCISDRPTD